ncbi:MAG: hypothetical protein PWQ06_1444 [Anaerophaga sp.]|nr:hypothetical protein [Anaerophaga thermohalophila]MDN5291205.1 hypothetical protein [Anaerophaga sp.]
MKGNPCFGAKGLFFVHYDERDCMVDELKVFMDKHYLCRIIIPEFL